MDLRPFFFNKGAYINIYKINSDYIELCHQVDSKVMKKDRPYIGIVLSVNGHDYFAPLTSAKESRSKLNNQLTIKLIENKGDFLGAIRFNNMIPCTAKHIEILSIVDITDMEYRNLLNKQYELIVYKMNDRVIEKAEKVYNRKINKPDDYASKLCCDFQKLENHLKNLKN